MGGMHRQLVVLACVCHEGYLQACCFVVVCARQLVVWLKFAGVHVAAIRGWSLLAAVACRCHRWWWSLPVSVVPCSTPAAGMCRRQPATQSFTQSSHRHPIPHTTTNYPTRADATWHTQLQVHCRHGPILLVSLHLPRDTNVLSACYTAGANRDNGSHNLPRILPQPLTPWPGRHRNSSGRRTITSHEMGYTPL